MAQRKRARTERRQLERAAEKLAQVRERLFALEPGGSAERPLEIETPALVDLRAAAFACPRCQATVRLDEHAAKTIAGVRLREARVHCPRCGTRRSLWFRLTAPAVN